MKNSSFLKSWGILLLSVLLFTGCKSQPDLEDKDILLVANPMELNYRFQFNKQGGYREAADPVCEYFNGKYYLFASKSGGYWSSPDLANWTYIPCKTITTMEHYAPTVLVMDDAIYFMSSSEPKIFRNANPDTDSWEEIGSKFKFQLKGSVDPAFFRDDDGKVYIYWGCSDKDPIIGVEVDPKDKFNVIGEAKVLIEHNHDKYGWEVQGESNELGTPGWNEGPCMIKHNGKYYLQYASPGTQFRVYADGIYVGDHPLGPFTYMESSPFSFKPGGFIGGAGHGHTFKDKYGNYWHVASMKISQRHMFERRLGLFPVYITEDGDFGQHTVWTDYPFMLPQGKVNFKDANLSVGWNLLSFRKKTSASSTLSGFPEEYAVNEYIENWWSAETGNPGEWFQVDLGEVSTINGLQVNFADQDFTIRAPHDPFAYQFFIEISDNGTKWKKIVDKSLNTQDAVHDLIVLKQPVQARYIRITNAKELPGKFSLYGFRIFGKGNSVAPGMVTGIKIERNPEDTRRFSITWDKQENATGYIIHTGLRKDQLYKAISVFDNHYEGGWFNRDSEYHFQIEAFNENGTTGIK